jgi:hypothetical protein
MKKIIMLSITLIITTKININAFFDYKNYNFENDIKVNDIKNNDIFGLQVPNYVSETRNLSEVVDHFKYLPIFTKGIYEYEYESTNFIGTKKIVVEFLGYSEKDSLTAVLVTYYNKKEIKQKNYSIKVSQRGLIFNDIITGEERIEIPIPLFKDKRWSENGNENRVIDFSSKVETPTKTYDNCLKILTNLKENGKIERYYSENIGLVKEVIKSEDATHILTLKSYTQK